MKTFLLAHLYLAPFIVFTVIASMGHVLTGALFGLVIALAWSVWRYGARPPAVFLTAQILALLIIASAFLFGWPPGERVALSVLFAFLFAGSALSVAMGKPWTSDLSAGEFSAVTDHPVFLKVNTLMSLLWTLIYGWFALAAWHELPDPLRWVPLALGGVISIFGPKRLVDWELTKLVRGDTRNDWPAPDFKKAKKSASDDTENMDVDVAIIGAGIGGLTAAALLADSGLKVAVFEQHDVPGGFAHNWLRRGKDPLNDERPVFRFDSGVHAVSGAHTGGPVDRLFTRLGLSDDLQWLRLDQRYLVNGKPLDVPRDWRAYVALLGQRFPDQADGIRNLFNDLHAIFLGMYSQVDQRSGIPGVPTDVPAMMSFAENYPLATKWRDRPWSELLDSHVTDTKAKQLISTLALYITDQPDKLLVKQMTPIFGYYFNGGHYPAGGSGHLTKTLVKAIEARGGELHLCRAVTRIVTDGNAATGLITKDRHKQQQRIRASAIVSNMDTRRLVDGLNNGLIAESREAEALCDTIHEQLGDLSPACSAVGVNLGLRGKLDMPPVVHGHTEMGELYMVSPSTVDPTAAPDGYCTLELLNIIGSKQAATWFEEPLDVSALTSNADRQFRDLRHSPAYANRKQDAGEQLINAARTLIPDLDERIVYRADSSPITFARYSWTSDGAIYGTNATRGEIPTKSPLRNLVMAGAMTHGAGVEAVLISGAYAAEALRPGLLRAPKQ